jgi:hypothetical protein
MLAPYTKASPERACNRSLRAVLTTYDFLLGLLAGLVLVLIQIRLRLLLATLLA